MTDQTATKSGLRRSLGILGFGAAACVACCVGPIVAFLGGVGVLGALSTPFVGGLGLAVAVAAVTAAVSIRRRRRSACSVSDGPVAVAAPIRRTAASEHV